MFRASSCPSSGATTTAVAASGLPSELGGSSAVDRGWGFHDVNIKIRVFSDVTPYSLVNLTHPSFVTLKMQE